MASPKPVSITQVETVDYDGTNAPTPLLVVGDLPASSVPVATTTTFGTVKKAATVAAITPAIDGTGAGTAVNAILTALKAAGIMA